MKIIAATTALAVALLAYYTTTTTTTSTHLLSILPFVLHYLLYTVLILGIFFFIRILFKQFSTKLGEAPLFSGTIPYLGLAAEFGTDCAKLLRRLAVASGDSPAFTAYIAGQRMTFIKSPLDFSKYSHGSAILSHILLDFLNRTSRLPLTTFDLLTRSFLYIQLSCTFFFLI